MNFSPSACISAGDLLRHRLADRVGVLQRVAGELLQHEEHLVLVRDDAVRLVEDLRQVGVRVLARASGRASTGSTCRCAASAPADRAPRAPSARRRCPAAAPGSSAACPATRAGTRRTCRRGRASRTSSRRRPAAPCRSTFTPFVRSMISIARPRIVRFASPRKSILSRPISATCAIANCVVGIDDSSPRVGRCSGTCSASGSREITTPAACVLACRATPSSRRAVSTSRLTCGSTSYALASSGLSSSALLQRHVQRVRHEPRHAVDVAVAHAERAAGVADRRLRAHGAEGDDLRDAVVAVLLGDVADHLVAPVVRDVEVDVGRLLAVDVQEALEDEPRRQRVDERDVERVEDDARRRGAAHAEHDAGALAELRDVVDDEEVVGEPRLLDDVQLVLEPRARVVGRERIAPVEPLAREVRQVFVRGDARQGSRAPAGAGGRTPAPGCTARRRAACSSRPPAGRGTAPASRLPTSRSRSRRAS